MTTPTIEKYQCYQIKQCVIFRNIEKTFREIEERFFKEKGSFLSSLIISVLKDEKENFDYRVNTPPTQRKGNVLHVIYNSYSQYRAQVLCHKMKKKTLEEMYQIAVGVYCSFLRKDEDYYQTLLLNSTINYEEIYKEGFNDGLKGKCPPFLFPTEYAKEVYEDGYQKGIAAATVRGISSLVRHLQSK